MNEDKYVRVNCPTFYMHGQIGKVVRETECGEITVSFGDGGLDFILFPWILEPATKP